MDSEQPPLSPPDQKEGEDNQEKSNDLLKQLQEALAEEKKQRALLEEQLKLQSQQVPVPEVVSPSDTFRERSIAARLRYQDQQKKKSIERCTKWEGDVYLHADIGLSHDRNKKFMEDECIALKLTGAHPVWLLAGVFDGHSMDGKSGKKAALTVRNNLPTAFLNSFDLSQRSAMLEEVSIPKLLTDSFKDMENLLREVSEETFDAAGTTATFACIHGGPLNHFNRHGQATVNPATAKLASAFGKKPEEKKEEEREKEEERPRKLKKVFSINTRELHTANVGDSEGFLFSVDPTVPPFPLTYPHVSTDESERQRCRDAGAVVTDNDGTPYGNRVNGMQVTRSLGDFFSPQTIPTPHVTSLPLAPDTLFSEEHYLFDCMEKEQLREEEREREESEVQPPDSAHILFRKTLSSYLEYSIPPPLYLVMGSDGLWDVIAPNECHELISQYVGVLPLHPQDTVTDPDASSPSPSSSSSSSSSTTPHYFFPTYYPSAQEISSYLINEAIARYNSHTKTTSASKPTKRISRDNVSIVVVKLEWCPLLKDDSENEEAADAAGGKKKKKKRGLLQFLEDLADNTPPEQPQDNQISMSSTIVSTPQDLATTSTTTPADANQTTVPSTSATDNTASDPQQPPTEQAPTEQQPQPVPDSSMDAPLPESGKKKKKKKKKKMVEGDL